MYTCVCVYIYIYMFAYTHIYIYIYIYIMKYSSLASLVSICGRAELRFPLCKVLRFDVLAKFR